MLVRRRHAWAAALWPGASALAQAVEDAPVKARLSLTLARFTQWPPASLGAPADPLAVCVLHRHEPVATAFLALASQTVGGRPLRVLLNPDKLPGACHVLFVHESASKASAAALEATANAPVLTIGDGEGFAARGGMVEMVNVSDSIKLDVNLKALRAAQLGLSSQVLKLARQIRD